MNCTLHCVNYICYIILYKYYTVNVCRFKIIWNIAPHRQDKNMKFNDIVTKSSYSLLQQWSQSDFESFWKCQMPEAIFLLYFFYCIRSAGPKRSQTSHLSLRPCVQISNNLPFPCFQSLLTVPTLKIIVHCVMHVYNMFVIKIIYKTHLNSIKLYKHIKWIISRFRMFMY